MNEEFLHYIWQHKLYKQNTLQTECGQCLEIIHPGEPNSNAGPDFFNAKIKIDNTLWAGNVEVHCLSSQWKSHQHQKDKAYDNVILHVVEEADELTKNSNGSEIPMLRLKYSDSLKDNYLDLKNNKHWLACANSLSDISPFEISIWIQRMLIERLECKMKDIQRILDQTTKNWDETFYRLLFRSFGFGVNGDPFELLAQSLPLKVLLKYCNNISLVEALLFGQAGLLKETGDDEYLSQLTRDYTFLKNKHQLKPIEKHLWKFLRLRPSNFPTIRLAQLASLMIKIKGMFGAFVNESNIKKVQSTLQVGVSQYWETHYVFCKKSDKTDKNLGANSKKLIIINTIIPYLFSLGKSTGQEFVESRAFDWLSGLKEEKNSVLDKWVEQEISVNNAGDSQALIYLSNNYCKRKKCLHCSIGHKVLAIKNKG